MKIILYLPLIIALTGLVLYALASNAKAAEAGRIMFAVGLLAYLLKG